MGTSIKPLVAFAVASAAAFSVVEPAAAACSDQAPKAITSKSADGKSGMAGNGRRMPPESANDDIGLAAHQMGNLRSQAIDRLAKAVQVSTGQSLDLAYVDHGYSGARAASAAKAPGIDLEGRQAA